MDYLDTISTGLTDAVLDVGRGEGDGYFSPAARCGTGTPPVAAVVGMSNKNDKPDIAYVTASRVGVILR